MAHEAGAAPDLSPCSREWRPRYIEGIRILYNLSLIDASVLDIHSEVSRNVL
jgi:hypothetical protein